MFDPPGRSIVSVNAATIECINAFQALLDVTSSLRAVQEHLSTVHQALTSEIGDILFYRDRGRSRASHKECLTQWL